MTSRDNILANIRRHLPQSSDLPELTGDWIEYEDPVAQFCQTLEGVGGLGIPVKSYDEINEHLRQFAGYQSADKVVSLIEGVGEPTVDFNAISDPHELGNVDFAIAPGQLAVAENGAVWIDDSQVKHRSIYFITQNMAFVVPANAVVNNMHEAYQRISVGDERGFGCFISGPSKTADIEQSLVIGAHGSRTQLVFLLSD
ncbi:MAG: LUD domain-containing protein [bacterium]|nr:LUD domain-containing protein [bacterium]